MIGIILVLWLPVVWPRPGHIVLGANGVADLQEVLTYSWNERLIHLVYGKLGGRWLSEPGFDSVSIVVSLHKNGNDPTH